MKIEHIPHESNNKVQKVNFPVKEDMKELKKEEKVTAQETEKKPNDYSIEDLSKTIKGLNEFLKPANTSLHFRLHEELDKYYVQLIDSETEEVIKEIPSEKMLDIYANMLSSIGILVDHEI
ncbi:MAG: flagellar protein FlaG [Vulcanibacillus sp.]